MVVRHPEYAGGAVEVPLHLIRSDHMKVRLSKSPPVGVAQFPLLVTVVFLSLASSTTLEKPEFLNPDLLSLQISVSTVLD